MLKQAKAQGNEIEYLLSLIIFLLFQVDSKIDFDFEECPKWNALTEVVKEIKEEVKLNEKYPASLNLENNAAFCDLI